METNYVDILAERFNRRKSKWHKTEEEFKKVVDEVLDLIPDDITINVFEQYIYVGDEYEVGQVENVWRENTDEGEICYNIYEGGEYEIHALPTPAFLKVGEAILKYFIKNK